MFYNINLIQKKRVLGFEHSKSLVAERLARARTPRRSYPVTVRYEVCVPLD